MSVMDAIVKEASTLVFLFIAISLLFTDSSCIRVQIQGVLFHGVYYGTDT